MLVLHHPTANNYHQSPQSQPCLKPLRKLHLNSGTTQARPTEKRGDGNSCDIWTSSCTASSSEYPCISQQKAGKWTLDLSNLCDSLFLGMCSRNMYIVRLYQSRSEDAFLSSDVWDGLFIHSQDSSIPGPESHPTRRHFSGPKETSRLWHSHVEFAALTGHLLSAVKPAKLQATSSNRL